MYFQQLSIITAKISNERREKNTMIDENKHNILYFENPSMRGLHASLESWQNDNQKRFLSMSIHKDGNNFCCIALTNPSEVVITDAATGVHAKVRFDGRLNTN
jgi:hypothetical protein